MGIVNTTYQNNLIKTKTSTKTIENKFNSIFKNENETIVIDNASGNNNIYECRIIFKGVKSNNVSHSSPELINVCIVLYSRQLNNFKTNTDEWNWIKIWPEHDFYKLMSGQSAEINMTVVLNAILSGLGITIYQTAGEWEATGQISLTQPGAARSSYYYVTGATLTNDSSYYTFNFITDSITEESFPKSDISTWAKLTPGEATGGTIEIKARKIN